MESGNRIITATSPRMTTQQAAHGEIQAFERPMLADGFHGILRTSGREAARGGASWGKSRGDRTQWGTMSTAVRKRRKKSHSLLIIGRKCCRGHNLFRHTGQQESDTTLHLGRRIQPVGQPQEGDSKPLPPGGFQSLHQNALVLAIGFAYLALHPIAPHRTLEPPLRNGHQHRYGRLAGFGRKRHEKHTEGEGGHGLVPTRKQCFYKTPAAQALRLVK